MKKMPLIAGLLAATALLVGCSDDEVGDVSLGLFTTKDIKIQTFSDPEISGVTCHISHVKADFDFADPSDMGISCRQTGPITKEMMANVDRSKNGEVVFKASKSILFKTLKIRRIYDDKSKTLMYLSYSTKETQGSYKHSLTTVPLYGSEAWTALIAEEQAAKQQ
ncbi:CreA family protein [Photobacterium sp. SDRW27]|uniref:CreA family protein n=1 Tax=Photobacterium obscurum TaxID=2829490 RepID=UPI0022448807|nr:CreA family protein [Photobacterium obscurum]MCW8328511.1 CreA family protein [Photobacterium obscurum]